jgi:hypothetical protein
MAAPIHAARCNVYHPHCPLDLVNHGQHRVKRVFTSLEPSHAYSVGMDLGFDPKDWPRDSAALVRDGAPDWFALRDLLGAAWSARRALESCAHSEAIPTGSFDVRSAAAVASLEARQCDINPTALGNGKPSHGIEDNAAGAFLTGGRGL